MRQKLVRRNISVTTKVDGALRAMAAYREVSVSAQIAKLVIDAYEKENNRGSWGEAVFLAPVIQIRAGKLFEAPAGSRPELVPCPACRAPEGRPCGETPEGGPGYHRARIAAHSTKVER